MRSRAMESDGKTIVVFLDKTRNSELDGLMVYIMKD